MISATGYHFDQEATNFMHTGGFMAKVVNISMITAQNIWHSRVSLLNKVTVKFYLENISGLVLEKQTKNAIENKKA